MFKQADISFAVSSQATVAGKSQVQFSTQDRNSAKLIFKFFEGRAPLNLVDVTPELTMIMDDGSKFVVTPEVTENFNGVMEYTLKPNEIRHYGRVSAELTLKYPNDKTIGGFEFGFTIKQAMVDRNNAPLKEYYVQDLETIKKEVQAKADSIHTDIDTFKAGVDKKTSDIDKNLTAFKTDIDSRTKAVETQVNAFEADIAQTTVVQVDTAKGEHANLDARIKSDIGKVTEALTDTSRKVAFIDLRAFGAKGDGVADDTTKLQQVIDYARANKIPAINYDKSLVFNISAPLYIDRDTEVDFGFAFLNKTTNTIGTGSETFFTVTDSYTVDAFIIVRHPKDYGTSDSSIRNVNFTRSAPNRVKYGVFAPRLARCKMENIWSRSNTTDYCTYGYQWYLIPVFNNIRQDAGLITWVLKDDGSQTGGSTSINANQIVGYDQDGCYEIFGCSYTMINMPLIDRCNKIAFNHNMCPGLTINSPSVEQSNMAMFLRFVGTKATVNSPRILYNRGSVDTDLFLNLISFGSYVTINSGDIGNYDSGTDAKNFPIYVTENSHAVLNNVKLPINGNTYRGLTNGSTLIINSQDGSTYRDSSGVGQKINGLRKLVGTAAPTTGEWKRGEEIINLNPVAEGVEKWICTAPGTPGTWMEVLFPSAKINRKFGEAYWTGDGALTSFSLNHGLGKKPNVFTTQASNVVSGTAGISHATVSDTQLTVVFKQPIPSGSIAYVKWEVTD